MEMNAHHTLMLPPNMVAPFLTLMKSGSTLANMRISSEFLLSLLASYSASSDTSSLNLQSVLQVSCQQLRYLALFSMLYI